MARSEITAQPTSARDGLELSFESANADGNSVANTGQQVTVVRSSASSDRLVTQVTGGVVRGLALNDPDVTVPAGSTVVLGPWPTIYNQDDGTVHLDYDDETSLEVAVIEVG
ncbi:hypothetical protein SAMN06265360_10623 [Haloechinothrix alba]|uniref:Uncharacterized protein n=1 Tax=Haloechinothrix alba TaxID=664784 RepID=A0A238WEN2_9PSEU|nr:hypothetical protein [Haloechinothrix alba]SNR44119.1 hypothetical protein SAMN06265360_10623 [Haloechinothrix alba]